MAGYKQNRFEKNNVITKLIAKQSNNVEKGKKKWQTAILKHQMSWNFLTLFVFALAFVLSHVLSYRPNCLIHSYIVIAKKKAMVSGNKVV